MKTFKDLFGEIIASDDLKKAYEDAVNANTVEAFLKDHGCEATLEDIQSFFKEQGVMEMTDDQLSAVAGGTFIDPSVYESVCIPWRCDPKYSSRIGNDWIDITRICY